MCVAYLVAEAIQENTVCDKTTEILHTQICVCVAEIDAENMPVMLVIVTRNNFCYSNRASYTAN